MTYGNWHKENMCDKCNEPVGKENLVKVPFLYLDCNDKSHPDVSHLAGYSKPVGYRQYWICLSCQKEGV